MFDAGDTVPDESVLRVLVNGQEVINARGQFIARVGRAAILNAPMVLLPMEAVGTIAFEYTFLSQGNPIGDPLRFEVPVSIQEETTPPAAT